MTLKEYDLVRLRRPLPEHGLLPGAIGTIVLAYEAPGAFEVEFADEEGVTIALATLGENDIEHVGEPAGK